MPNNAIEKRKAVSGFAAGIKAGANMGKKIANILFPPFIVHDALHGMRFADELTSAMEQQNRHITQKLPR